jgi:hypothetical protein
MPEKDPNEAVRVKDKDTGHVYTIRRSALPHGNYQELKSEDAVDANTGDFLPPVFAGADKPAAQSKES